MGDSMKRLAFAIGVLALGFAATAPAHADFAIVKFNSGYCRIWTDTAVAPRDGTFIWWQWHHYLRYNLPTLEIAEYKLRVAVARHLCWH
jgi:hypothetical protein